MASDLSIWAVDVRCGDYTATGVAETYHVVAGDSARAGDLAKRVCRVRDGWEVTEVVRVELVAVCDGVEGMPDGE